jgi:type IV secretory pathway TrbD component
MLGVLAGYVALIKSLLIVGAAGAAAAAVGYFARSLIAGGSGIIVGLVAGALVAVGANALVPKDPKAEAVLAQVRLAEEQARAKALEHEKQALQEVLAVQNELENEAVREQERLATLVDQLQHALEGRKEECPVAATKEDMDAIRNIQ